MPKIDLPQTKHWNEERVEYRFDNQRFMEDVRKACGETTLVPLSLRDIEALINVSASTLSRISNGFLPDLRTFMGICGELNLAPGKYFRRGLWRRVSDDAGHAYDDAEGGAS